MHRYNLSGAILLAQIGKYLQYGSTPVQCMHAHNNLRHNYGQNLLLNITHQF